MAIVFGPEIHILILLFLSLAKIQIFIPKIAYGGGDPPVYDLFLKKQFFSASLSENLSNYRYGALVARYPLAFIICTMAITAVASTGFIVLEEEKDGLKLWQPQVLILDINYLSLIIHYSFSNPREATL